MMFFAPLLTLSKFIICIVAFKFVKYMSPLVSEDIAMYMRSKHAALTVI